MPEINVTSQIEMSELKMPDVKKKSGKNAKDKE